MTVSVVIPATRPSVTDLRRSLFQGTLLPDEVIVVSNEVDGVRFSSDVQPIGVGDAGLRRNIGADLATGDILVFLDDDQIAPRGMLEAAVTIAERDGFCWGHHRFIDFTAHPFEELLDLPPEAGRSRENGVNRWHGWQSSYAGLFAIRRDLFWEIGGFDLAFLGHHGSEDQQLGRRLSDGKLQSYIHEPPFAWHPEITQFHVQPVTNVSGVHEVTMTTINGHDFLACGTCPSRQPIFVDGLTMSEQVVIPYSREQFTLTKERI